MTREEFAKVVVALSLGTGKSITSEATEVYFDCLGDLPFDVMKIATKRVLLEHRWATFPSIAELREAAAQTNQGTVAELSSGEAWALAWRAVGAIDPEVSGSYARGVKGLPALVVEAMEAYGINPLCYGKEPVGVIRGQFIKIYEQLAVREKRTALLPPKLTTQIESRRTESIQQALAAIGEPSDGNVRSPGMRAEALSPREEKDASPAAASRRDSVVGDDGLRLEGRRH